MKISILRFLSVAILIICMVLIFTACGEQEHVCNFGEWQPLEGEEATCIDDGKEIRVCIDDPTHTEIRKVEATGEHKLEGEYISAPGGHWQLCSVCGEREEVLAHESAGPATTECGEICKVCGYEMSPKLHMLTGKKIIIIGNSHTYFGGTVIENSNHQAVFDLGKRDNDKGYFYQLCQSVGATGVNVVDWTFGNHSLKDLFSGNCQADRGHDGHDHFADLTDNNFDYVIFQNGSTDGDEIHEWIDFMMNFFKEGNPDTKFVMLVQARAHNDHAADATKYAWLSDLDEIENKGVIIADWGAIAYDLYSGKVRPTDPAILPFDKTSFVIAKTAADGYHPSLLAGYLTSLTAYCAITGESAVGQSYAFCGESTSSYLDFDKFYANNYKVNDSNFREIFESKETMAYLQKLVNQYLEEKGYRNYQ